MTSSKFVHPTDYVRLCCKWMMPLSCSSLVDWLQRRNAEPVAKAPGNDKWVIKKENQPYDEAFQDQSEGRPCIQDSRLRNRMEPVERDNLEESKVTGHSDYYPPYRSYLKMSSSQLYLICLGDGNWHPLLDIPNNIVLVLTINPAAQILLIYLEPRDWKATFFQVIPQRKRCDTESEEHHHDVEEDLERKRRRIET
ncbi:hypothetical protein ACH5RR_017410 [Cinchona calisaya]|uniref:Uncharacterized protein n=1 Tax=Cinchona calisaya TaxID=153742 RepID=A0ABD2ZIF4_9GENT